MENIGKSNEQPKESANRNVDDQFANARKPLNQRLPFLCTHQGDCLDCPCVSNQTYCREGCKCPSTCARRFPRCNCRGQCEERTCPCMQMGFECIASRCAGGRCSLDTCCNVLEGRPDAEVIVKISTVAGAGKGLVAESSIREGAYVGEYRGGIVHNEHEHVGKVSRFQISQGTISTNCDP
jgi:histone-lysine N-methyltransferase EZH2